MVSFKKKCKAAGVAALGYLPPLPKCLHDFYMYHRVGSEGPAELVVDFVPLHAGVHLAQRLPVDELPPKAAGVVRLIIISDTHERHRTVTLPAGDVFVHCGDILMSSSLPVQSRGVRVLADFNEWLATVPCTEKVVIGGNHDTALRRMPGVITNAVLLENTAAMLPASGLKVYGNPYSEGSSHNNAWQDAEPPVSNACADAHIVLSHECASSLQQKVLAHCRPLVWASGHNHTRHGVDFREGTLFANAAIQDGDYKPLQAPIVVDLLPP